jgi:hypothetical protein
MGCDCRTLEPIYDNSFAETEQKVVNRFPVHVFRARRGVCLGCRCCFAAHRDKFSGQPTVGKTVSVLDGNRR